MKSVRGPSMSEYLLILVFSFLSITSLVWFALWLCGHAFTGFQTVFTESADRQLSRLFVFADSKRVFFGYLLLLICVPLGMFLLLRSIPMVLVLTGILIVSPKIALNYLKKNRKTKIDELLPSVLDQLAASMLAGATFVSAVQNMVDENDGPIRQEFSLLLREIRVGTRLEEALDNLGERVCSEDMDLVISAVLIARDVGGNLAETFKRLSTTLRRKQEMDKKIKALTAQGILQGWVVCFLPFAILFALHFIEKEAVYAFWNSVLGWCFLAIIVVLELIGGLVIREIVRIDI